MVLTVNLNGFDQQPKSKHGTLGSCCFEIN